MKFLRFSTCLCCLFMLAGAGFAARAARPRGASHILHNGLVVVDDYEDLIKNIIALADQKKYDEALVVCQKAIELRPTDPRPLGLMGWIYGAQRKFRSASETYAKAIALGTAHKKIYLLKARADWYRNAQEEAIATCRQVLKIDPSLTEANLIIGDILQFKKERKEEAVAAYRAALKSDPLALAAYGGLGQTLAWSGDTKGAEEVFRQGMEIDPKKMAGRFELGRMLTEQGRLAEARTVWEGRTTDEERTFPRFITVLERAEHLKKATDELAAKPNDPVRLVAMGDATMENDPWVVDGRQERAIEFYKKALERQPGMAAAQYGICKAYVELADNFKDKNKNVDEELAKLKTLDPKLAKEIEEYRKTFQGSLRGLSTVSTDQ